MCLQSQTIPTFAILNSSDIYRIKDEFEIEYHRAGDILLSPGEVSEKLYFIYKGLVVAQNNEERTTWLEMERQVATDIVSFLSRKPSQNYLKVYENDTVLVSITYQKLHQLYSQHHNWALWGTALTQMTMLRMAEFSNKIKIKDASQRYNELLDFYPHLLERVALKEIASCLGINQVSLSRIRAGKGYSYQR